MTAIALPHHAPRANYPPSRASKRTSSGGVGPSCCWCGQRLKGKHMITCSASCKSSLSRCKRRECANALVELGMPKAAADRLLKAYGMPEVERRLNALHYSWYPKLKRFFMPYNARDGVNELPTNRRAA